MGSAQNVFGANAWWARGIYDEFTGVAKRAIPVAN
jgi:hypothetical protein